MALFGFGKKKEEPPRQPRVPVDEVVRMKRQGFTNNQVVQALQRNGYQTHQIFDALSQADLRAPSPVQGISGMPPLQAAAQRQQPFRQQQPTQEGAENFLGAPPNPNVPPEGESIEGPQSPEELPGFGEQGIMEEGIEGGEGFGAGAGKDVSARIEEVSEAIIEEKWQDLLKDFNKLVEWKGSMEQRMAALEQRVADLKTAFDSLQKSVVDKVSDYDKSVKDVASEMKALEQVFQKIIPTLTENVNELSRITKSMKTPSKK